MESDLNSQPVITGIGLLTPLGRSAGETWDALLAGRSISDHSRVPSFSGSHRATRMALAAATEAIALAGWTEADRRRGDCGLFVGTSKGEIEGWADSQNAALVYGLSGVEVELSRGLKFGAGPRLTISSACSSGLHALVRGALAIRAGEARRVLVVATEASVQPIFVSSFKRLGVLAPEGYGCRPFDAERAGFVISEAAAAVCLEAAEEDSRGRAIVRVDRCAIGGDATHLTAGDPDAKTLRHLLARIRGAGFDLIHAHATGTAVSDPVELAAIECIAGDSRPVLYSHKAALGHSLGAAGLVSVVVNCLCHLHGRVPGNIRSTRPLPATGLQFSAEAIERPIRRSLAIAAGFGGPVAVISCVS
jgi:3-oxoacyl-[acyl-carrier-protein] synthase II